MILSTRVQVLQTVVNTRRTIADYRQTTDVAGSSAQTLSIDAGDTVTQTVAGRYIALVCTAAIQLTFSNGVSSETLSNTKFCVIETPFTSFSVYNDTTDRVTVEVFVGFIQD